MLILHGSPGSGKSTLARAISEQLREAEQTHAVIDLDDLHMVYPEQGEEFALRGLKAIWPNYAAVPNVKVLVPTVIPHHDWYQRFIDATPGARRLICELVAPAAVLRQRIIDREPNDYWRARLLHWVDVYLQRDEGQRFGDFQASTGDRPIAETAAEIIRRAFQ